MKIFLKIISVKVSILIILLPLLIFIFHLFYQKQFIMLVNDKNKEEIIQILKEDCFKISNNNIYKIELKNIMLSRYSVLKIIYKNNEFDEFSIKQESRDYKIIKYMSENAININKMINIMNLIVLFFVIGFILYSFKIKK